MPTPRAVPHRLHSGSSRRVSLRSGLNAAAVGPEHCCQSSKALGQAGKAAPGPLPAEQLPGSSAAQDSPGTRREGGQPALAGVFVAPGSWAAGRMGYTLRGPAVGGTSTHLHSAILRKAFPGAASA